MCVIVLTVVSGFIRRNLAKLIDPLASTNNIFILCRKVLL